ncbi:MAG: helix-turn-helix transcriptional regulator [bacterium]
MSEKKNSQATKLKTYREKNLISKTELARNAGISLVTLDRIEKGYNCRLATKRKVLEALDVDIENKDAIFPAEED